MPRRRALDDRDEELRPSNVNVLVPHAGIVDEDIDLDMTPVAIPRDDVDWTRFVQDPNDPITDHTWCVWTHLGQSKGQYAENKNFQRLVKLHRENYNIIPPFDFVTLMQEEYNLNIRPHLKRSVLVDPTVPNGRRHFVRFEGPAWPAQNIWNYTLTRVMLPSAVREDVARTYQRALYIMQQNQLFLQVPGSTKTTVCLKTLHVYNSTWNIARPLFDKIEGSRDTNIFTLS